MGVFKYVVKKIGKKTGRFVEGSIQLGTGKMIGNKKLVERGERKVKDVLNKR